LKEGNMGHRFALSGYCARAKRTLLLAAMLPEFNRICTDLTRAREELRVGTLGEEAFGDRILALFVDADSLMNSLETAGTSARRIASQLFAMSHGIRYLIDSLRENYVGIVARNGSSFVAADRALQAAVAWRSGMGATNGAEAISDATRP